MCELTPWIDCHAHLIQAAFLDRCTNAHLNGVEVLPLFAAGLLFALHRGLDHGLIGRISLIYLALRVLFNGLYIYGTTKYHSVSRSVVWTFSIATAMSFFYYSA